MKINVFEGARRIALGFGFLWSMGFIGYAVIHGPDVSIKYVIPDYGMPAILGGDCGNSDAHESPRIDQQWGSNVSVSLCFKASLSSDGRMLVPYEAFELRARPANSAKAPTASQKNFWDDDEVVTPAPTTSSFEEAQQPAPQPGASAVAAPGNRFFVHMNTAYSTEVRDYTSNYAKGFKIPLSDHAYIKETVWKERFNQWVLFSQFIGGGLAALWAVVAYIGWIVRGFFGIPWGKDSRPSS